MAANALNEVTGPAAIAGLSKVKLMKFETVLLWRGLAYYANGFGIDKIHRLDFEEIASATTKFIAHIDYYIGERKHTARVSITQPKFCARNYHRSATLQVFK